MKEMKRKMQNKTNLKFDCYSKRDITEFLVEHKGVCPRRPLVVKIMIVKMIGNKFGN